MPPYEALYGRKCRSLICWSNVGERKHIRRELAQQTNEAIEIIKTRLIEWTKEICGLTSYE